MSHQAPQYLQRTSGRAAMVSPSEGLGYKGRENVPTTRLLTDLVYSLCRHHMGTPDVVRSKLADIQLLE